MLSRSFIRFIFVGSVSTILDFYIYMLLSSTINITISKCFSMICACTVSFILNRKWTFQNDVALSWTQIIKYIFTQSINIAVNTIVNYIAFKMLQNKIIPYIIATLIAMIVNYLLQKKIVFRKGST